jgi:hypothetical protein
MLVGHSLGEMLSMNSDKVSKVFGIISLLIAAGALIWNVYVFRATTQYSEQVLRDTVAHQQESAAVELHNNYLNLAFQNSSFAFEKQDILNLPEQQQQRYILFAIATVRVAERLHALTDGGSLWNRSIEEMLSNHTDFIATHFSCEDFNPEFSAYLKERIESFVCV